MHSIQVHYCNWVEHSKSLKRSLRARSGVWSCRVWDIIDTRSDQAAYFGRSAEKMFDMIGWSCVEDCMRKAKGQWRNFSINGTAKPASFFFFWLFFLICTRGFEWIVASIESFVLPSTAISWLSTIKTYLLASQVQRIFFFSIQLPRTHDVFSDVR